MRTIKSINEFYHGGEWESTHSEVRDFFLSLEDNDCDVQVNQLWLDKELLNFNSKSRPGHYPGYIVTVTPKFNNMDFPKHIEYLKEISDCNSKLPNYYDVYKLSPVGTDASKSFTYRFSFLDKNWKSVVWDEDEIWREKFLMRLPSFKSVIRYGSINQRKEGNAIILVYTQPVTKDKSDINLGIFKSLLDREYPNHEFEIIQDTQRSTGLQKKMLVNSISIHCKGKKKS